MEEEDNLIETNERKATENSSTNVTLPQNSPEKTAKWRERIMKHKDKKDVIVGIIVMMLLIVQVGVSGRASLNKGREIFSITSYYSSQMDVKSPPLSFSVLSLYFPNFPFFLFSLFSLICSIISIILTVRFHRNNDQRSLFFV